MLHNQIINWYRSNKRDLPWRETKDPYLIWISEIMLQQTKVATVIDYFRKFTKRFPTVGHLAEANEQEVLKLWQGLGYYSRARNLHQAAKTIQEEYNGKFPNRYPDILKLKGIGTYTAAAIASFAFNLPYAAIDGNVYRVLSRIYAIATPIDSTSGKKLFQQLAQETMCDAQPEIYNQAIIEFGALQCTPKSPQCHICPIQEKCLAYQSKQVEHFPVKSKQIVIKNRYFYYLFISCSQSFIIEKREKNDIWKNLYQFPLIESDKELSVENIVENKYWKDLLGEKNIQIESISDVLIHKLTHLNIHSRFIHIKAEQVQLNKMPNLIFITENEIDDYPFPKLIENQLAKLIKK